MWLVPQNTQVRYCPRSDKIQGEPSLTILGLIRARYDSRTIHSSLISSKAAELLKPHRRVFQTVISERTVMRAAAAAHQIIYEYAPDSQAANEYSKPS